MIKKRNLVFLGPPGAGKGTLSEPLVTREHLAHISTGEILRAEIMQLTELGKAAKIYMNEGKLVPDQIVADIVAKKLAGGNPENGFILDGFPRTERQAELLDEALEKMGMKLDAVILLEAPEELLLQRLTARVTCRNCGASFNLLFNPPKIAGICDICGGELYQRSDDSRETAESRLKIYHERTAPLIEYYDKKSLLARIDSSLSKDEGFAALLNVLN